MSSTGAVQPAAVFNMPANLATLDVETMFMALLAERAETMETVIESHAADMARRNNDINKLNEALQWARANRPSDTETLVTKSGSTDRDPDGVAAFMATADTYGVSIPDTMSATWPTFGNVTNSPALLGGKQDSWDQLIANIETSIDSMSSDSQLKMIQLQGLMNKRDQIMEMCSNVTQKFSKVGDTIVGNMR